MMHGTQRISGDKEMQKVKGTLEEIVQSVTSPAFCDMPWSCVTMAVGGKLDKTIKKSLVHIHRMFLDGQNIFDIKVHNCRKDVCDHVICTKDCEVNGQRGLEEVEKKKRRKIKKIDKSNDDVVVGHVNVKHDKDNNSKTLKQKDKENFSKNNLGELITKKDFSQLSEKEKPSCTLQVYSDGKSRKVKFQLHPAMEMFLGKALDKIEVSKGKSVKKKKRPKNNMNVLIKKLVSMEGNVLAKSNDKEKYSNKPIYDQIKITDSVEEFEMKVSGVDYEKNNKNENVHYKPNREEVTTQTVFQNIQNFPLTDQKLITYGRGSVDQYNGTPTNLNCNQNYPEYLSHTNVPKPFPNHQTYFHPVGHDGERFYQKSIPQSYPGGETYPPDISNLQRDLTVNVSHVEVHRKGVFKKKDHGATFARDMHHRQEEHRPKYNDHQVQQAILKEDDPKEIKEEVKEVTMKPQKQNISPNMSDDGSNRRCVFHRKQEGKHCKDFFKNKHTPQKKEGPIIEEKTPRKASDPPKSEVFVQEPYVKESFHEEPTERPSMCPRKPWSSEKITQTSFIEKPLQLDKQTGTDEPKERESYIEPSPQFKSSYFSKKSYREERIESDSAQPQSIQFTEEELVTKTSDNGRRSSEVNRKKYSELPGKVSVASGTKYSDLPGRSSVASGKKYSESQEHVSISRRTKYSELPKKVSVGSGTKYSELPGRVSVASGKKYSESPERVSLSRTKKYSELPEKVSLGSGTKYSELPRRVSVSSGKKYSESPERVSISRRTKYSVLGEPLIVPGVTKYPDLEDDVRICRCNEEGRTPERKKTQIPITSGTRKSSSTQTDTSEKNKITKEDPKRSINIDTHIGTDLSYQISKKPEIRNTSEEEYYYEKEEAVKKTRFKDAGDVTSEERVKNNLDKNARRIKTENSTVTKKDTVYNKKSPKKNHTIINRNLVVETTDESDFYTPNRMKDGHKEEDVEESNEKNEPVTVFYNETDYQGYFQYVNNFNKDPTFRSVGKDGAQINKEYLCYPNRISWEYINNKQPLILHPVNKNNLPSNNIPTNVCFISTGNSEETDNYDDNIISGKLSYPETKEDPRLQLGHAELRGGNHARDDLNKVDPRGISNEQCHTCPKACCKSNSDTIGELANDVERTRSKILQSNTVKKCYKHAKEYLGFRKQSTTNVSDLQDHAHAYCCGRKMVNIVPTTQGCSSVPIHNCCLANPTCSHKRNSDSGLVSFVPEVTFATVRDSVEGQIGGPEGNHNNHVTAKLTNRFRLYENVESKENLKIINETLAEPRIIESDSDCEMLSTDTCYYTENNTENESEKAKNWLTKRRKKRTTPNKPTQQSIKTVSNSYISSRSGASSYQKKMVEIHRKEEPISDVTPLLNATMALNQVDDTNQKFKNKYLNSKSDYKFLNNFSSAIKNNYHKMKVMMKKNSDKNREMWRYPSENNINEKEIFSKKDRIRNDNTDNLTSSISKRESSQSVLKKIHPQEWYKIISKKNLYDKKNEAKSVDYYFSGMSSGLDNTKSCGGHFSVGYDDTTVSNNNETVRDSVGYSRNSSMGKRSSRSDWNARLQQHLPQQDWSSTFRKNNWFQDPLIDPKTGFCPKLPK